VESNINFDLNVFLNEIKTEIKNKKNVILNNLDYQMDCINNRKKQLIESVNTIRNNILISIHDKRTSALAKYEDISKHNIISNSSIIDQQQIIENSNYIQYFLTNLQIEHKLALNDEFSFDIGLIGKIVEPYQEKMLKKIVTLKRIDSTNNIKIEFNRINCDYRYHKSIAVLPLFKNKLVKFSFTKDDTICMDLIHSDGTLSKSVIFLEEMRTMPILSSYSSNVVICLRNYGANEFSNCIYLLNSNLDIVKQTNHLNSIDSIYMNGTCIITMDSIDFCTIYDFEFNKIKCFGQTRSINEPFYIEKISYGFKLSKYALPKVFGYDESHIFMHNFGKIFILSIKTGQTWKYLDTLSMSDPYYLLDSKHNIIKVDREAKTIGLLHRSLLVKSYETVYDERYDQVFITSDDELAITDNKKTTVLFI
jgi:hypothetical protein